MRIGLLTDLEGQRAWHQWLAADLSRAGHELLILRPSSGAMVSIPSSLKVALWLDPILFKLKGSHAFDEIAPGVLKEQPGGLAQDGEALDVIIDASGGLTPNPEAHRIVRLLFNGEHSELAAVSAILDGGPVAFTIDDESRGESEAARPGIERPGCLTAGLDHLLSAVVELLAERIGSNAAQVRRSAAAVVQTAGSSSRPGALAGARYVAGLAANKVARYLDREARGRKRSWAIATRRCPGAGLVDGPWPGQATYQVVKDDGRRYYADPILFKVDGRTHLFAEEFPFATGRGIISVAEVDGNGNVGTFRPVLERGYHLSYPFVFAHAGEIWMIPEACERGAVELFRAEEYPHRWRLDRVLLEDVPGCDATIVPFGGSYYMVLTASRWRGSTWDKQRVYVAPSPLGPWREQADGIVRVDSTRARPAGPPIVGNGRVLRPAQDCSQFYGGSMTLLEVQQMSSSRCHEVPVATIKVVSPANVLGTHTYALSGTVEAVDVWGEVASAETVTLECRPAGSAPTRSDDVMAAATAGSP